MGCSKKDPDCMDVHSTAEISAHFFARWPNLRIMPSVSLTAFFNPLCKVINMCCLVSNYLSTFFTLLMHLFLCDFDTDDFDLKNC